MGCTNCNTPLPVEAKFCQSCGIQVQAKGITIEQKADIIKGDVTGAVVGDGSAAADLNINASQQAGTVEVGGTMTGAVIGVEGGTTMVGGTHHHGEKRKINTGGGAYVEGNVDTGSGDFVGRDKVVHQNAQAASPNFCFNCGDKLMESANFCAKCGTRVGDAD